MLGVQALACWMPSYGKTRLKPVLQANLYNWPLSHTRCAPVSPHMTAAIDLKLERNGVQLSAVTYSSDCAGEPCAAARSALVAVVVPHIGAITRSRESSRSRTSVVWTHSPRIRANTSPTLRLSSSSLNGTLCLVALPAASSRAVVRATRSKNSQQIAQPIKCVSRRSRSTASSSPSR